MDTNLLYILPTEQARCREIARHYSTLGSIGCFATALIEQALQRADRAIIEGGEDAIRSVLRDLQAFDLVNHAPGRQCSIDRALAGAPSPALATPPVGRRTGRIACAA